MDPEMKAILTRIADALDRIAKANEHTAALFKKQVDAYLQSTSRAGEATK